MHANNDEELNLQPLTSTLANAKASEPSAFTVNSNEGNVDLPFEPSVRHVKKR